MSWKPIDTAPLDGTLVDLWVTGDPADIAFYCGTLNNETDGRLTRCKYQDDAWRPDMGLSRGHAISVIPTHWDDIPKAPSKEGPKPSRVITNEKCKHLHFAVKAKVIRLIGMEVVDVDKIDIETSHVTGHTMDLTVACKDCGLPFRFLGMQAGSHPNEPRVSIDATELRAPLEPAYVREVLGQPLIFGKA